MRLMALGGLLLEWSMWELGSSANAEIWSYLAVLGDQMIFAEGAGLWETDKS